MGISGGKYKENNIKQKTTPQKPERVCSTEDMEVSQKAQAVIWVLRVKLGLLRMIILSPVGAEFSLTALSFWEWSAVDTHVKTAKHEKGQILFIPCIYIPIFQELQF